MKSSEIHGHASRAFLALLVLPFAFMAGLGWLAPLTMFAACGVRIDDAAGFAEIRAAYGGLFFAASVLFTMGARWQQLRQVALLFASLTLGGFVFGRLYSLAVDGIPNRAAFVALIFEAAGFAAATFLLVTFKRK